MAPLPRPFLRFAVGTTLLIPAAACTSAGNERPPIVNTPAPEPAKEVTPTPQEPAPEVAPRDHDGPPGADSSPVQEASSGVDDPDDPRPTEADMINTPPPPELAKAPEPPRTNTPRPQPKKEPRIE